MTNKYIDRGGKGSHVEESCCSSSNDDDVYYATGCE